LIADRLPEQDILTMRISQNRPEHRLRLPSGSHSLAPQRHRFRPRLEGLEERTVLSTLTVLNNLDSGAGSLRDTIAHSKSGDTIQFAPSLDGQTITLTSDELAINNSLDIEGPGASQLSVSGNDTFRVFDIVNQGLTVTIAGLTITHGQYAGGLKNAHTEAIGGAGIANASSTLVVANDVLSYNQAANHGGAISNSPGGVLTATNSTFLDNRAIGMDPVQLVEGGAIWNSDDHSSATISGCTFLGNQAIGANGGVTNGSHAEIGVASGGAIHNDNTSSLTVENSTFIGNQAIAGNGASASKTNNTYLLGVADGGAIANHPGAILAVSGSTFSNNQAIGGSNTTGHDNSTSHTYIGMALAGGVENNGTATVRDSAFVNNEALGGNHNTGGSGVILNGVGRGGGLLNNVFNVSGTLALSNCTFTNNKAVGGAGNTGGVFVSDGIGGGLLNFGGATANVTDATFSGNQAIGGAGGAGQNGGDGLGGGIDNLLGSTLTVSGCTLSGNQAMGGAGGAGGNGGNGFGGGVYNGGQSTVTILTSTITANQATGGSPGTGGTAGLGEGGGLYLADGGIACLDFFTSANVFGNTASTSNKDIFGVFTIC
jgi:hypothetical protein